ncbi:MAG: diaminopimelate decarboxylase [Deltaproteobacteria bacterium]|nr:diaminopimelate decarboxylase [Deltaproteobacteria bacterium]
MHHFSFHDSELYCESVPLARIAEREGTPLYVYSRATLERHFTVFDNAFAAVRHLTCYSVKANSNLAILRLFGRLGSGVDVVSGGEILRALAAGIAPEKIVYSGVGKTRPEIELALARGILMFNVESAQELELINRVASEKGARARIALRVNPDVDPRTHPYISTGLKKNKFGVSIDEALDVYARAAAMDWIEVAGIDCHIGSQITTVSPFVDALGRIKDFVKRLRGRGIALRFVDLGGGLGITYDREEPPEPDQYAAAVISELADLDCTLILEPGRCLVGNAGCLVARVLYTKQTALKEFVIVDAAMNDLIRPSLYEAHHALVPVRQHDGPVIRADIVGPICETGDFLARDREITRPAQGDLLAAMSAGAYGFSMSSNYNSRLRAAEVLVDGSHWHVIRRRETFEDLVRCETIPACLG